MKIGFLELVVILVVALIVIGPDKLPEYAKNFGRYMRDFKKYSNKLVEELNENVVEPMKGATEPLQKVSKEITKPFEEIKVSVENIQKPSKEESQEIIGEVIKGKNTQAALEKISEIGEGIA